MRVIKDPHFYFLYEYDAFADPNLIGVGKNDYTWNRTQMINWDDGAQIRLVKRDVQNVFNAIRISKDGTAFVDIVDSTRQYARASEILHVDNFRKFMVPKWTGELQSVDINSFTDNGVYNIRCMTSNVTGAPYPCPYGCHAYLIVLSHGPEYVRQIWCTVAGNVDMFMRGANMSNWSSWNTIVDMAH